MAHMGTLQIFMCNQNNHNKLPTRDNTTEELHICQLECVIDVHSLSAEVQSIVWSSEFVVRLRERPFVYYARRHNNSICSYAHQHCSLDH